MSGIAVDIQIQYHMIRNVGDFKCNLHCGSETLASDVGIHKDLCHLFHIDSVIPPHGHSIATKHRVGTWYVRDGSTVHVLHYLNI